MKPRNDIVGPLRPQTCGTSSHPLETPFATSKDGKQLLNEGILNLNSEDFDTNPQRLLNRPSSMSRASPPNRFILNQTQPIRQSAEQVSQLPAGKATLQQINNINIESNEMLGK